MIKTFLGGEGGVPITFPPTRFLTPLISLSALWQAKVESGAKFGALAAAAGLHEGGCDGLLERLARRLTLHRWDQLSPAMAETAPKSATSRAFNAALSVLQLPLGDVACSLLEGLLDSRQCSAAEAHALADFTALSGAILAGRAASPPAEGEAPHLHLVDSLFRAAVPAAQSPAPEPSGPLPEQTASEAHTSACLLPPQVARRPSLVALFQRANLTAAELDIVLVSLDNLGFDSSAVLCDVLAKDLITVAKLEVHESPKENLMSYVSYSFLH